MMTDRNIELAKLLNKANAIYKEIIATNPKTGSMEVFYANAAVTGFRVQADLAEKIRADKKKDAAVMGD